jgi:glutamate racemase
LTLSLSDSDKFSAFLQKRQVTILIADSGLGGISICAAIARELVRLKPFGKVSLIYFNAWPEQDRGYNRLRDTAERIQVFDRALEGMMQFKPDFILIACNTLSVLYPRTQFSRTVDIPVVDIVGFGVDMMIGAMGISTDERVVILGTVTTIDSRIHYDRLVEKGIQPRQIVTQACDQLATEIEKGPASTIVSQMIETFMQQAARKIDPGSGNLYAALCCTHYGYCQGLIRDRLEGFTERPVFILNPNHHMAAYLLSNCREFRFSKTRVAIQVVSKITWEERKIRAISGLIRSISVDTANALLNYAQIPSLFT